MWSADNFCKQFAPRSKYGGCVLLSEWVVLVDEQYHILFWLQGESITANTEKSVYNDHSNLDKTKILMTNGSLMKVKSIAEFSPLGAFCSTFDLH